GHRDRRPLGGPRGLPRLPLDVRHRTAPARRDRADQATHRRGEPAALQRHADRRVRVARRRARAGRLGQRLHRRAARLLGRAGRPRPGHGRQAGPGDAGRGRGPAGGRGRRALTRNQETSRDPSMASRRDFFRGATAITAAATAASVARAALAALPEPVIQSDPGTMPPLAPPSGRPYRPVVTLNGWTLPWRMNQGVKEFHLVAEPVVREMAPGFKAHLWGYNGQSPGPTIEVVEGDRVRIFVTNRLPEHTSIHWHGQRLPNGMDGVNGLTQKGID